MNNKTDKKYYIMLGIAFLAVFAIYNIIVLVAFGDKNDVFWISYAFMCIGFAVNVTAALLAIRKPNAEAIFLNIPLWSFSIYYFGAELFASIVFMLFRGLAPAALAVVIQSVMLLLYIVFAVMALITRSVVSDLSRDVETKVRSIKNLAIKVKVIEDQCMDPELKRELHKVQEGIRFSDPMTTSVTEDLDEMIESKVKELRYLCSNNSKNEAMQACFQLSSYLSERNMLLKNSK